MEPAELAQIIEAARRERWTKLDLRDNNLFILPEIIGNLPELASLDLYENQLTSLPESICNLSHLTSLYLNKNQLTSLPDSICMLSNLTSLVLSFNQLTNLPQDIGNLSSLTRLYLNKNQLTSLPNSMTALANLTELYLNDNPWIDLSILQSIPNLKRVYCFDANLPRRYWTHQNQWKSEWLLNEDNAKIRNTLIERLGYDRIFNELALFQPGNSQLDCIYSNNKISLNLEEKQLTTLSNEIEKLNYLTELNLGGNQLTIVPEGVGSLLKLTELNLGVNQLTSLPESIDNLSNLIALNLQYNRLVRLSANIGKLSKLTELNLANNHLTSLPKSIGNLPSLTTLWVDCNQLVHLPKSICNLSRLMCLHLNDNQLVDLPKNIGNLSRLVTLDLSNNQLVDLPKSMENLHCLTQLNLDNNPWLDLSSLQNIPNLKNVFCFKIGGLSRRYWTKLSEWKPEWLLDEDNAEIRRILIEKMGYEKICAELNATTLDTWREYTLLKIDGLEKIYDGGSEPIDTEPMVLLKMTCPSTVHIHILRVPPEMLSAEAAIVWVNHGIHPDDFVVQT